MADVVAMPVKDQALELVHALPPDATWEDLMYSIYVRQAIESGIRDADADRVVELPEVRRQLGRAP